MKQPPLKFIHDKVASFAGLFMGICFLFSYHASSAQQAPTSLGVRYNDVFTIMSPLPDSTVVDGELFISLRFINTVELSTTGLRVMIDERLTTTFIKVNNHNLTILYPLPLAAGEHNIEIVAKEKGYEYLAPVKWRFFVRKAPAILDTAVNATANNINPNKPKTPITLSGSIVFDNRKTNLSGPGAENRQEPPRTTNLNVNADFKVGKVSFPIRLFQTSDESSKFYAPRGIQSRNYFQTGISHEKIELLWGDMAPSFDKLVLTGLKMRGYKFALNFKRFQMQAVHGQLARAVEGLSDSTKNVNGIPLSGWVSNAPGSYIFPGIYKRNLDGVRFVFGNKLEGTYLGLNFLRVRDDTNSIKYGSAPKDNVVVGADQTFVTNQNRLKGNLGWSYSLFTNDISKPAVSKDSFERAFKIELKVDPYKYRNIFITNYSSVKPAKNAMSAYINLALRSKKNTNVLTGDFRYFGAGYQSLGNPYLKVDVRQVSVQDQIYMFKRRMNLSVKYQYQDNNRSKTQYTTVNQHWLTATYILSPGIKWPQLMVNYMLQNRRSPDQTRLAKTLTSNDFIQTITSSLIYTLKTGKSSHSINIQYNSNERIDKIYSMNNNSMKVYSAGLREQIAPLNLGLDLQFTRNITTDPVTKAVLPFSESADTRLRFTYKKIKTVFAIGYIYSHMLANQYTLGSTRTTKSFSIICNYVKNFTIELEGGKSPNINISNPSGDYQENYIYARITHSLGYKFR